MSKATVVLNATNALFVDFDLSKVFIFGNRFAPASFKNNTGSQASFVPGTLLARDSSDNTIVPLLSTKTGIIANSALEVDTNVLIANRATGSYITDGVKVGDAVTVAGSVGLTGANIEHIITSVSALEWRADFTLADATASTPGTSEFAGILGLNVPIGVLKTDIVALADAATLVDQEFCHKGDIPDGKIIFQGSDDFDTVITKGSSRSLRDLLLDIGINPIPTDELTAPDNS